MSARNAIRAIVICFFVSCASLQEPIPVRSIEAGLDIAALTAESYYQIYSAEAEDGLAKDMDRAMMFSRFAGDIRAAQLALRGVNDDATAIQVLGALSLAISPIVARHDPELAPIAVAVQGLLLLAGIGHPEPAPAAMAGTYSYGLPD